MNPATWGFNEWAGAVGVIAAIVLLAVFVRGPRHEGTARD